MNSSNQQLVVAALILAAGASSRMGRPKQLLDWGGRPLVRAVAEQALTARIDQVLVVAGDQGARGVLAADPSRLHLVPFDDTRPLADIDTPEDYRRLQSEADSL